MILSAKLNEMNFYNNEITCLLIWLLNADHTCSPNHRGSWDHRTIQARLPWFGLISLLSAPSPPQPPPPCLLLRTRPPQCPLWPCLTHSFASQQVRSASPSGTCGMNNEKCKKKYVCACRPGVRFTNAEAPVYVRGQQSAPWACWEGPEHLVQTAREGPPRPVWGVPRSHTRLQTMSVFHQTHRIILCLLI